MEILNRFVKVHVHERTCIIVGVFFSHGETCNLNIVSSDEPVDARS